MKSGNALQRIIPDLALSLAASMAAFAALGGEISRARRTVLHDPTQPFADSAPTGFFEQVEPVTFASRRRQL
ncbi:MAG: hypothetical protein IPM75_19200 [Candidatus Competibacteraceae bacterium]|nr:hypothetical protein [Candidatus Competibacteraceae bacterium]